MKPTILAVDNDQLVLLSLKMLFQDHGIEIVTATSGDQGIKIFREHPNKFSIVILDYELSTNSIGMNGDQVTRELKVINPNVRVVVISGKETPERIKACSDAGADQFILKGEDTTQLFAAVKSMMVTDEEEQSDSEAECHRKISTILKMVGKSRELAKVGELVLRFANYDEPVLLIGESGVGKEGIARAVHENSKRRSKPYLPINCAAFPKELLESELFGHERGAFTGAVAKKTGFFEQANGGTVFLDEIGDMDLGLQAKILRVLQEKVIHPVGGIPKKVDFRIVAATHRNLKQVAKAGSFRQDLYYRLNYFKIEIPPLRERPEDIEPLVRHFISQLQLSTGKQKGISDAAMRKLKGHDWPGNVRDLEAIVKKAFALSEMKITPENLKDDLVADQNGQLERLKNLDGVIPYAEFESLVSEGEKRLLTRVLSLAGGVKSTAADMLGISPNTLNYRLQILGIEKSPARNMRSTKLGLVQQDAANRN